MRRPLIVLPLLAAVLTAWARPVVAASSDPVDRCHHHGGCPSTPAPPSSPESDHSTATPTPRNPVTQAAVLAAATAPSVPPPSPPPVAEVMAAVESVSTTPTPIAEPGIYGTVRPTSGPPDGTPLFLGAMAFLAAVFSISLVLAVRLR
jgi:hypothetical protein